MRKIVMMALLAAVAMPTFAGAQTRELRHDRQEIREQQRDVNQAIRRGESRSEIRNQQRDVREARKEYREDWRDWRRDHREDYRRPAYVGPRGYVHRSVVVGHRFDRAYYGRRYIVADPWRYHLPRPSGWQRWVRYGNDVVLVNIRNGRVMRVIPDFFW